MKRLFMTAIGVGVALAVSCGGSLASPPCALHEALCGAACLDVQSNNQHCGGCDVRCGDTELCVGGHCQSGCAANEVACGGRCADLSTDPSNCGACGVDCGVRAGCVAGVCDSRCPAGQAPCDDAGPCVDALTDNANCGACGVRCGAGTLCLAGACVAPCAAGWTYCKGASGYTCVDSRKDATNCGRCGHDCLGSTCSNGACDPVALATGQSSVIETTLDATNVYWTLETDPFPTLGSVMMCATGGCQGSPTALATGRDLPGTVVSDGQVVYWTEVPRTGAGVFSCDRGGCSNQPTLFASTADFGQRRKQSLAVGGDQLYWWDSRRLATCPTTGCVGAPGSVDGSYVQPPLLTNGADIYFNSNVGFGFCSGSGCVNKPFFLGAVAWVARDSANAYLATGQSVVSCPLGVQCAAPKPIAPVVGESFATDGVSIYWAQNGAILSCPVTGCNPAPVVLAVNQPYASGLLADAARVYWASADRIMAVAK